MTWKALPSPAPGDSTQPRPPSAVTDPLTIAHVGPIPPRGVVERVGAGVEALPNVLVFRGVDADSRVLHDQLDASIPRQCPDPYGPGVGRELDGVLDQLQQDDPQLAKVRVGEMGKVVWEGQHEALAAAVRT